MAFTPPPWVTPEEAAYHGNAFCCLFTSKAHWDHYLATGDIRRPTSARRLAKLKADPLAGPRERLRHRVYNAKAGIHDAERRIAEAREQLGSPFDAYRAELTIKEQTARVVERAAALKRAETDLAIFDQLHTESE